MSVCTLNKQAKLERPITIIQSMNEEPFTLPVVGLFCSLLFEFQHDLLRYLRVIQTAQPTSDALGVPINLEHGLGEAHFRIDAMKKPQHDHLRFLSYPNINVDHQNMWRREETPGYVSSSSEREDFVPDYYRRLVAFSRRLEIALRPGGSLAGKTVICFSHAASVVLVASLLQRSALLGEFLFAPCGIYHLSLELERGAVGEQHQWTLTQKGDTNPHVSENAETTFPWGFNEERCGVFHNMWEKTKELRALRSKDYLDQVHNAGASTKSKDDTDAGIATGAQTSAPGNGDSEPEKKKAR